MLILHLYLVLEVHWSLNKIPCSHLLSLSSGRWLSPAWVLLDITEIIISLNLNYIKETFMCNNKNLLLYNNYAHRVTSQISLHFRSHCSTTLHGQIMESLPMPSPWSTSSSEWERHILIPRRTSSWFTAVLVLGGQAPSSHSTPWWRGSRQRKPSIFMSLSRAWESRECWWSRQWLVMG